MATDLERLVVSLEANVKKYETELKRSRQTTDTELDGIEKKFTSTQKGVAAATSNLAAQFQDIGVSLQGGQSPLTVALQQGTQISSVLGQRGAAGAAGLLAGALQSVLSPMSLLTIGVIALGGYAVKWLTGASADVKSLDDLLQEHEQQIKSLKASYGEAGEGLSKLFNDNSSVIESLIRGSIVALQEQYKKLSTDAVRNMTQVTIATDALGNATGIVTEETSKGYERFKGAIDNFRGSVQAGTPDVKTFRDEVARIESGTADPAIRKIAGALLEMTKESDSASTGLITAQRAIAETGRIASGEVARLKEFNSALSELQKLGMPKLDDRGKAAEALQKALAGAGTNKGAINAAESEYLASVDRIGRREKEEADKKAADEAKRLAERNARRAASDQKAFENSQENVRKSTAMLQIEFDMIGKTAQERDKARMVLQLESEAKKKNIELSGEERAKIDELATAYAAVAEKVRLANMPLASFARQAADTSRNLQDAVVGGLRSFEDAFVGVVSGAMSAQDAFKRMADAIIADIARIAIRQAITGPIAGALGGVFGGGGGLSAIFGGARASGGPVSKGKAYIVGENRPEVFVPGQNGTIIPRIPSSSGGGQTNVNVSVINNSAAQVQTQEVVDGRGNRSVQFMIDDAVASSMSRPGSATRGALRNNFGAQPVGVRR